MDVFPFNIGTYGSKSPSKCSIVLIGGKYLNNVDQVMGFVGMIAEDIEMMPYAVFLMTEKPGQDIKFTVSTRNNMSPTMYQVPTTRSSVVQFVMTCPGTSHSSTFTLHMRDNGEVDDGKVWGDLCREKRVNIAYNNENQTWPYFHVHKGQLLKWPPIKAMSGHSLITKDWEILDSFFRLHDIIPSWINCHYNWGWYDAELGRWTGATGKV